MADEEDSGFFEQTKKSLGQFIRALELLRLSDETRSLADVIQDRLLPIINEMAARVGDLEAMQDELVSLSEEDAVFVKGWASIVLEVLKTVAESMSDGEQKSLLTELISQGEQVRAIMAEALPDDDEDEEGSEE